MYELKLFNIADEKVLGLLFKILRKKFWNKKEMCIHIFKF